MFEITRGVLGKYDVASVTIRPPLKRGDVVDIELAFASKSLPGLLRGYLTVDSHNNYNPRVYPGVDISMSQSARSDIRTLMEQLAVQLRGELNDV